MVVIHHSLGLNRPKDARQPTQPGSFGPTMAFDVCAGQRGSPIGVRGDGGYERKVDRSVSSEGDPPACAGLAILPLAQYER